MMHVVDKVIVADRITVIVLGEQEHEFGVVSNMATIESLLVLNQNAPYGSGFGGQMSNTPLVILWPNSNGTVTLSTRQASGHVQPTPVASPPRVPRVSNRTNLVSSMISLMFSHV